MTRVHSDAKGVSVPTELVEAVVLEDALQAFDLLHSATCGKAPLDELCAHYGVRSAHQILQAREQIARLRKATTASAVGTGGEAGREPNPTGESAQ